MTFRQQAWGRRTRSRWVPRASAASRVPSGFLAALALSGVKILGAIVPLGGVLMLVGWTCLAVAGWKCR